MFRSSLTRIRYFGQLRNCLFLPLPQLPALIGQITGRFLAHVSTTYDWNSDQISITAEIILTIVITGFFTKLPWPRDSKGTFWSSSQAATCLPHMVEASR